MLPSYWTKPRDLSISAMSPREIDRIPAARVIQDRLFASGGPGSIAVVHDWLDGWRGGENVLAAVLKLVPHADLFSLVDFLPEHLRERIGGRSARTTLLQRLPGARRWFRGMLPFFPRAIESIDLRNYDLVISVSHAVAKGARADPSRPHLCYCLTPMRYAWDLRDQYLDALRWPRGARRAAVNFVLDRLQAWDLRTSSRVTEFAAISRFVERRIESAYGRAARVIYPPVDVDYFVPATPSAHRADFYLTASRWVPYKRIDLVVSAFRALPKRRLVVAGYGPDEARIRRAAGANVEFVGDLTQAQLRHYMQNACAFIFAAEEDFGIVPLEAQACGSPVIAFAQGGAGETIRDLSAPFPTGVLFHRQEASAITDAVVQFEGARSAISPASCRENAKRFSPDAFARGFSKFIADGWTSHMAGRA